MRSALISASVILLILVVTSIESVAEDVIYACVNKSGSLRIVGDCNECKVRENCISLPMAGQPTTNIEVVQNSDAHGWFGNLSLNEVDTSFRVTIAKEFDTTPLRIVLNDQIGTNGVTCTVWSAIEVQISDGSGFQSISNPGPCSQARYDFYDNTVDAVNLHCLALNLPAGTYNFRVVYSCSGQCVDNCSLGDWGPVNQDGSPAFQRRLIVEELR